MGVALSTNSTLAPISLASTVIGFISFTFTVATALRVFWANFQTFVGASSEIEEVLTNLRQSLYEERRHLRKARRSRRRRHNSKRPCYGYGNEKDRDEGGVSPEAALEAMQSAVKLMISGFRAYEKPFVRPAYHLTRDGYHSGGEEEGADYYHCEDRYMAVGWMERYLWLRRKSNFIALSEGINRIETRRIGMQVHEMSMLIHDMSRHFNDFDERFDAIDRLEHRISRVVGIRRIE
ncbi:hypothetical protein EJ08DRAFT_332050 [Tothia fuscella]|uniref:Uncharacterized protein n=1 Tax=Tothia fuscella TaxID=1048955 RepID=A0A9P4TWL9_9PEZI|nr:hypothetical protein EJ08DRAFT_332050 [Tothia fuscella]